MSAHPLIQLGELGQSPWYDFITRDLLTSGELEQLIKEDGLQGMTSNPTIFEKAIAGSDLYDDDIRRLAHEGHPTQEIFDAISIADVQGACDRFRPLYDRSGGVHGLVSIEVAPELANDTAGTVVEARRLWSRVNRPNVMVKIPGTMQGLPAIFECLAEGININITLLFSNTRYDQVIEAYLKAMEERVELDQPVDRIQSVASFFVSRVDTKVDPQLDARGDPQKLRGTAAIANACEAYALFEKRFAGERWERLKAKGANLQRPLWASTSTKDKRYPDIYYVEALIAPHTVNTLTPATFQAYKDHGHPQVRIHEGIQKAPAQLKALADFGIDLAQVTAELEVEGVASFAKSYQSLLAGLESKVGALAGA